MPVFNGEHWMPRAVQSLLNQSFRDFELIIVDNASTDASFKLASALRRDPRVRIVRNEVNIGGIGNFRKVLSLARGEYFMWAAVDDLWLPGFVAALVQDLDQHPSAAVAMSAIRRIGKGGKLGSVVRFRGARDPWGMSPLALAWALASSRKYNYFISGLFRRSVLKTVSFPVGVSPEKVPLTELALSSRFRYVDEILHHRQLHPKKTEERYPDDPYARLLASGAWGDLHHLWLMFAAIVSSRTVPLGRKLLAPVVVAMNAAARFYPWLVRFRRNRLPRRPTSVKWDDDALSAIEVGGPFPDHGEIKPGKTSAVFKVSLEDKRVSVVASASERPVRNEVPIAKAGWRNGELAKLFVFGEFTDHGDGPPVEVERVFKVYQSHDRLILRAVDRKAPLGTKPD